MKKPPVWVVPSAQTSVGALLKYYYKAAGSGFLLHLRHSATVDNGFATPKTGSPRKNSRAATTAKAKAKATSPALNCRAVTTLPDTKCKVARVAPQNGQATPNNICDAHAVGWDSIFTATQRVSGAASTTPANPHCTYINRFSRTMPCRRDRKSRRIPHRLL
jgi:hypothetical protein